MSYFQCMNMKSKIESNNLVSNVSALLPVKNGERFLHSIVPRILASMKSNDELFIINDGSTDTSKYILEEFANADNRISLINTNGIGLVNALNLGLSSVKHDWVARYDVDDEYSIRRLEIQRQLIHAENVGIFSDYRFISNNGDDLGRMYSAIFPACTAVSLLSSQRTAHPSALINRLAVQSVGGYLVEDFPAEDLSLWLRLSYSGNLVTTPSSLLKYRIHPNSITQQNYEKIFEKKNTLIEKIQLPDRFVAEFIQDFDKFLGEYSNYPDKEFRINLMIRDLFILEKFYGHKIKIRKYFSLLANLTKYRHMRSLFTLYSERNLRMKYRKNQNYLN
jgi:glycosyltransferase involved in cell wall biosynthesis